MRFALFLAAAALLPAQAIQPKSKAADYPSHIQMDSVTLAGESDGHSLPTAKGILVANDYLVVEVAFYGAPFSRLQVSPDQFSLRVNGHGPFLLTQRFAMVAASFKPPTSGGRTAIPPKSTVSEREQDTVVLARIRNESLPEGERTMPFSGLIYFPYKGPTKSITSLDLIYDGPMGKYTLKLLPSLTIK